MERPSYTRNIQALGLRPRCNTAQYTGATPAFLSAIRHNCNRFFGLGVWRVVDLAARLGPPARTFQWRPPDGCGALLGAAGDGRLPQSAQCFSVDRGRLRRALGGGPLRISGMPSLLDAPRPRPLRGHLARLRASAADCRRTA